MTDNTTPETVQPTIQEKLATLKQFVEIFGKDEVAKAVDMKALLREAVADSSLDANQNGLTQEGVIALNEQSKGNFELAREDPNLHFAEANAVANPVGGNALSASPTASQPEVDQTVLNEQSKDNITLACENPNLHHDGFRVVQPTTGNKL